MQVWARTGLHCNVCRLVEWSTSVRNSQRPRMTRTSASYWRTWKCFNQKKNLQSLYCRTLRYESGGARAFQPFSRYCSLSLSLSCVLLINIVVSCIPPIVSLSYTPHALIISHDEVRNNPYVSTFLCMNAVSSDVDTMCRVPPGATQLC
jgi:hypothetical protein